MTSKKLRYTLLVSGALLGGVAFSTQINPQSAFAAEVTSPVTSTVPSDQTVKTTGANEDVDQEAEVGKVAADMTPVGNNSKVAVKAGYDADYNPNGTYMVTVNNREWDPADTSTQSTTGVYAQDATYLYKGDTIHYAEKQSDGTWQINSLTGTSGTATAGQTDFQVDVSSVVNGEGAQDYEVTDGVSVHVGYTNTPDEYGDTLVNGGHLNVTTYGDQLAKENGPSTEKVGATGLGAVADGFINVPFTIHYYNAAGDLMTGYITFTNGTVTKNTATNDEDSSSAAESSVADSDSTTPASSATTPDSSSAVDTDEDTTDTSDEGAALDEATYHTQYNAATGSYDILDESGNVHTPASLGLTPGFIGEESGSYYVVGDDGLLYLSDEDGNKLATQAPATSTTSTSTGSTTPVSVSNSTDPKAANGNVQVNAGKAATTTSNSSLPQTGEKQQTSVWAGIALAMVGFFGLFGLARRKNVK